ncbi:hypothetical protein FOA52_012791 [Chlamydomonas sp. UWO 241]|nr:hypothetical protein FOA52_012791 [Chlamydomonas sp. UWO 241]
MLVFIPLGLTLEAGGGSVQFAHLLLVLFTIAACVYVLLTYVLALSHLYPAALHTCVVGLSGVIFGLIVVENAPHATHAGDASTAAGSLFPVGTRSLLGLVAVPAVWYPWVLLVLWQLLVPAASFLGHLSGLLAGQLWVGGHLRSLSLSRATAARIEASPTVAWLAARPSFVPSGGAGGLPLHQGRAAAAGGAHALPWAWGSGGSGGGGGCRLTDPPAAAAATAAAAVPDRSADAATACAAAAAAAEARAAAGSSSTPGKV